MSQNKQIRKDGGMEEVLSGTPGQEVRECKTKGLTDRRLEYLLR